MASVLKDELQSRVGKSSSKFAGQIPPTGITQVQVLPINALIIDERYQRELRPARIRKMVRDFNPALFGMPEVANRGNGSYTVIDGQHRVAMARTLGFDSVRVLVHENISKGDEAKLFVLHQTERKALHPIQRFRASLYAKDPRSLALEKMLKDVGWKIEFRPGMNSFSSITAAETIYDGRGAGVLAKALNIIVRAWPDDRYATSGALLKGMVLLLDEYALTPTEIAKLGEVDPDTILKRAYAITGSKGASRFAVQGIAEELRIQAGLAVSYD